MIRASLVAGSAAQWAAVLRQIDRDGVALSRRELNQLLDTVALTIDAEREARALARARHCPPPLRKGPKP